MGLATRSVTAPDGSVINAPILPEPSTNGQSSATAAPLKGDSIASSSDSSNALADYAKAITAVMPRGAAALSDAASQVPKALELTPVGAAIGLGLGAVLTPSPAGDPHETDANASWRLHSPAASDRAAMIGHSPQSSTTVTPAQDQEHSSVGTSTPANSSPKVANHTGHGSAAPVTSPIHVSPAEKPRQIGITSTPTHRTDAADTATLAVDVHDRVKQLPGFTVGSRTISRIDPSPARLDFGTRGGPRDRFIKNLGATHADELHAAGFSPEQIKNMQAGVKPKGWDVHHIIGLAQGGSNDESNLLLIKSDKHLLITGQQNSAISGIPVNGDPKEVDVLLPPSGIKVYGAMK